MRSFAFEKDLVDEVLCRWVGEHPMDPACRKVLDTHLAAQRDGGGKAAENYERALRELRVLRPWDEEITGLMLKTRKTPCLVKGGLLML